MAYHPQCQGTVGAGDSQGPDVGSGGGSPRVDRAGPHNQGLIPPWQPGRRAGRVAVGGSPSPGHLEPPWGWAKAGLGHQPMVGGQDQAQ